MSSSFSYELDEEQIRSTLLNGGEQEPIDSAWNDFEANYVQNVTTTNPIKFKLPEFNLNINRNVVLPVVFIAVLVGISAIMLSFVDFKTNAPANVEKALVPNPENYNAGEAKSASLVKKEPEKITEKPAEVKKDLPSEIQKPIATPTVEPPQQMAAGVSTPEVNSGNNASVTSTQVVQTTQPEKKIIILQDSTARSMPVINSTDQPYGRGRKKRRKITPEQVETIKAPSILGAEATKKEEEPELEIKLN